MDQNGPNKPIVFVFSTAYFPFIGGAEVAIKEVAMRLKNEYDFFIFTSRLDKKLPKKEIMPEGLVVRAGFGNRFDKFWLLIFGWCAVRRELRKHNKKIIFWIADFSFGAAAAGFLKIFYTKIPLIFTIQYGEKEERISSGRFGLMNFAFRLILAQADHVTAISSYLLNLCEKYGYIGGKVIIHNGVDLVQFKNKNLKINTTDKKSKIIITVSRLVHKNGVDVLIRAFAKIAKEKFSLHSPPPYEGAGVGEGVHCQLFIVGDGPELEKLKVLSENLKVSENVKFFGVVPYDEIQKYLHEADIFARPSRSEGMGNAFVEALAAGVPIIGTPVGGILDIIKEGETGLFAKTDDPDDLAKKIRVLLEDGALAARIVENGQKMIEEKFLWNKIADRYKNVFNHEFGIKKRVLIATGIFPPDVGGPATYSKILLEELPKKNTGVKVLSFGSVRYLPKVLRHVIYGLKIVFYGRNADIVFAQDPVSVGFPAVLAAKLVRRKFFLKIVGDYAWEQGVQRFGIKEVLDDFLNKKYGFKVELLRRVEKWVANRAGKVIVPSEYLKKVVMAWGIGSEKISVIYNAFHPQILDPEIKQRAEKDFNPSIKKIVSAGRLVPWKGFDALIEIMPDILKKFPKTILFIIGDGPEKTKLENSIQTKRLGDNIFVTGNLHGNEFIYKLMMSVFVLNTSYEGLSHQILEVMAIGAPVVTTDAGGNPELIENGKNGFLVKFNDKKALIEKITRLLSDENLRKRFIENAQKKAQEFSLPRMISDTIKILNQ